MSTQQNDIATLERDAALLVEQLAALKTETKSYQSVNIQLDKSVAALAGFLERTENLTQKTHSLIDTTNSFLASGLHQQLEAVTTQIASLANHLANLSAGLENLKTSTAKDAALATSSTNRLTFLVAAGLALQLITLFYLAISK